MSGMIVYDEDITNIFFEYALFRDIFRVSHSKKFNLQYNLISSEACAYPYSNSNVSGHSAYIKNQNSIFLEYSLLSLVSPITTNDLEVFGTQEYSECKLTFRNRNYENRNVGIFESRIISQCRNFGIENLRTQN